MLNVTPIRAFNDNYIWCIENTETKECIIVDPGDHKPVKEYLAAKNLTLKGIFVTHHHFDHIGGITELAKNTDITIYGPINNNIKQITRPLKDDEEIYIIGSSFKVKEVPGHTLDHIAYYSAQDETHVSPLLFCGDTLFSGGCGRLFEGTPAQMLNSLKAFKELPGNTEIYCAHEYTLSNLSFLQSVLPSDEAISAYTELCHKKISSGKATIPSTIDTELSINLFLNSAREDVSAAVSKYHKTTITNELETFTGLRSWKDQF